MKKSHLLGSMLALSEVLSGGYSPFTQRDADRKPIGRTDGAPCKPKSKHRANEAKRTKRKLAQGSRKRNRRG